MPTCLGLYIEKNLIKYAKVSKEHEATKVEAFGVKFYEKIGDAIGQIVEETFSYKIQNFGILNLPLITKIPFGIRHFILKLQGKR